MMNDATQRPLRRGSLLALVVVAGVAAPLGACGSSGSKEKTARASTRSAYRAEASLSPAAPAPPLALRNYLGKPVNLASYRGKAVLVTFIYTHCPDVCPLITANLRVAQNLIGAANASELQIIAVSVDPRGDTRRSVAKFLAQHEMTGRMQYLVGSASELTRVWRAWGVGSERDVNHPDLVEHSGLIYGITGSGKRTTLYSASFRPANVAYDVPLLAAR